jgi:hypothetical protein
MPELRALAVGIALMGAVTGVAADATAAPAVAVFHQPSVAPAQADEVRDALAAEARRARIAWINASAPPTAPLATNERIRRGRAAYTELRFEAAIAELEAAATEAASTGAAGLAPADLSDLYLFRGLARVQLNDAHAWDDLVAAAALDPSRVLDPQVFPPRAVESFARAVQAAQAAGRATLAITAPVGCAITIDAAVAADGKAEVVRGQHFATARCPGQRPWGIRLTLDADRAVAPTLTVDAAPTDDELAIQIRAVGAAWGIAIEIAGAPAVVTLRRLGVDGRVTDGAAITLDHPTAVAESVAALAALIQVPAPPRPQRWWRSPWLWGAAGAAVATAVLLPFALGSTSGASSVTLRPTGLPTW